MTPDQTESTTIPALAAWENGRSLRQSGKAADAVKTLRKALAAGHRDYRLHDELGMALVALDRQEEAIGSFLNALNLKPDFDEACYKIGSAFASRGMNAPAAEWFARASKRNPIPSEYLYTYASVLTLLDHRDQAAEVFDQWVKAEPENPVARHMACAAGDAPSIERASAEYVCTLFDEFAARFDAKLAKLKYCGPKLILSAITQVSTPPESGWAILDAGCGTGLVGVAMKPHARRLIGIDLSAGMLSIARQRSIYDELIHRDVVDYLRDCDQRFDLVAAADVLTYIGDVSAFFRHTARVLHPAGLIAVVTEALKTSGDYRLNLSGRFSHSREYLEHEMNSAGITVASFEERVMRYEAGKPVSTWVAVGKCCGR